MNVLTGTIILVGSLATAGCSSSPTTSGQPNQETIATADQGADAASAIGEQNGLGTISHAQGIDRKECRKRSRTGTRIPRDVCKADRYNGLFPGGINMGTARESQPSYGQN